MAKQNRLHKQLGQMVEIESALETLLETLALRSSEYDDVSGLLNQVRATASTHREALQSRLRTIGGSKPIRTDANPTNQTDADDYPVTTAISQACGAINRAVIGYAMLRSIALRHRDSSLIGEDNTGDMAEAHTINYVHALRRIDRVLHNAVLWELDQDDETCQCTCPACGIGICMCAQGPRRTLSDIWSDAGPISQDTAVYVHPPRPGSAAELAGLMAGDCLTEADGEKLETHFVLQKVVSAHAEGDKISLRVQRASGVQEEVSLIVT